MTLARCNLCLENQLRSPNNDSLTQRKSLENIIDKLFSLKVNITDGTAHICMECNGFLGDCVKFYNKVQNAHQKILETKIEIFDIPLLKKEVSPSPVNIKNYDQTTNNIECLKIEDIISQTFSEDLHLKAECEYMSESSKDDNVECVDYSDAVIAVNHRKSQDISINNLVPETQEDSEKCPIKISALMENNFPSELFNGEKLIPKGKALKDMLNKFYNLFCDRCPLSPTFKSIAEMFEHHKIHHNVRGYVRCCDSKLHDRRQIALHMARHLQPSAFECPICKKLVSRPGALKSHMHSYHLPESERPYKCDQCDKSYAYLGALTLHKSKHLPEKEKKVYMCEVCQKKFTIQTSYITHVSIAHTTVKFICAVCGKGFRVKNNYLYHLSTHDRNGTNNVQCQVCNVMCVSNHTLRNHMKKHGSKNYSCEQCPAAYYTASSLRKHKKMKHTDHKPYKCSLCTKSYRTKQNLNQHMAQHTGEKRFVCEFCFKTFRQSGNYYTHRKRMHPEYKNTLKVNITDISTYICVECHRFLNDCLKFYNKVQNAHLSLKTDIKIIGVPLILKEEVPLLSEDVKNDVKSTDNVEYFNNKGNLIKTEDCCSGRLHLKTEIQNISEQSQENSITKNNYSDEPDISSNNTRPPETQVPLSKEDCSEIHRFSENDVPHVLFKNGRLIPKGETLRKLINNFYNLFCERCSESPIFSSLSDMFEHYTTRHNVKGFVKCCDSRLYGKKQISLHMARHLQPSAFECPICKKLVSRPGALKYHMQAYHLPESEKPYKCELCDKRFVYLDGFNIHKFTHLPEKEKEIHECKACRKTFTNLTYYKGHISRMHKSTDKFICAVCGKEFKMKSTYKYHLTTHERSETSGVQCQECGVWYANILTLRCHMKRHGSKNFTCEQCFSTYYTASDLRNHKKMKHSDIKPFKCSLCTKSFRKKQNLNQHMAQHTGEKRHVCEVCSRTFRQSGNYYTHRKRMHPEYKNISKNPANVQI